jgi:uncharacterized membrane protein
MIMGGPNMTRKQRNLILILSVGAVVAHLSVAGMVALFGYNAWLGTWGMVGATAALFFAVAMAFWLIRRHNLHRGRHHKESA